MLRKVLGLFSAVVFSALFTIALIYATVEIPRVINELLLSVFPDLWWGGMEPPGAMARVESLRTFGYVSFVVTLFLMIIGLMVKRGKLITLGSITLYLPTFSYFAFTMFSLAGIGVLTALWFPLMDLSPLLLRLGEVVYTPLSLLSCAFALVGLDVGIPLCFAFIGVGTLFFSWGTATWLYGKFKSFEILDFWIYRYSRHPQYLGFLLWSYGLLLLTTFLSSPGAGYVLPPSLPWLISALTVIGVALHEENMMVKRHGEKYVRYRDNTPFMLPLPKQLTSLITAPARALLKKNLPENGKEIAYVITIYSIMLVFLSLPSILFLYI